MKIDFDYSQSRFNNHMSTLVDKFEQKLTANNIGKHMEENIGKKEYRLLQAAYVHAAKKVGIKAYEMQAITWMAWRRHHGIV